jgi:hypothetical protein
MSRVVLVAGAAWVALLAASADAQGYRPSTPSSPRRQAADSIPVAYRPPPGMCRIWLNGVPPSQQPAPSDCTTAVRMRPANGRVIYGDDYVDRRRRPADEDAARDRGDSADDRRREPATRDSFDDPRLAGDPSMPDVGFGAGIRAQDICLDRNHDGLCDDFGRSGSACLDRYGVGRCDNFPRDARTCIDKDRDGRCDEVSRDSDSCVDFDRDGYCDNAFDRRLPSVLPDMMSAVAYTQGRRPIEVQRWLGDIDLTVRLVDIDRDGVPDRATWLDREGKVVQVWSDRDHDGRADRVEIYRDGERVRVLGQ